MSEDRNESDGPASKSIVINVGTTEKPADKEESEGGGQRTTKSTFSSTSKLLQEKVKDFLDAWKAVLGLLFVLSTLYYLFVHDTMKSMARIMILQILASPSNQALYDPENYTSKASDSSSAKEENERIIQRLIAHDLSKILTSSLSVEDLDTRISKLENQLDVLGEIRLATEQLALKIDTVYQKRFYRVFTADVVPEALSTSDFQKLSSSRFHDQRINEVFIQHGNVVKVYVHARSLHPFPMLNSPPRALHPVKGELQLMIGGVKAIKFAPARMTYAIARDVTCAVNDAITVPGGRFTGSDSELGDGQLVKFEIRPTPPEAPLNADYRAEYDLDLYISVSKPRDSEAVQCG